MSRWPVVAFGEILTPNRRPYLLGDDEDANLVGMRLYALGPFHRELKPAGQIRKKSHFVIRQGDVIYNKLFAWKGTFGIVPPELDGMFVSDKFPTYALDDIRVDPSYLRWYFRYPEIWEQARQLSTGSAALSKLTLNPPRFLDLTIPLPPIEEQRRVVEKLDRLAASASRIARASGAVFAASAVLSRSVATRTFAVAEHECATKSLGELGAYVTSGPRSWRRYYAESGERFYRAQDVGPHGEMADQAKQYLHPPAGAEGRHARVTPGDVLIVITGATVGRVAMVGPGHEPGFVSQHVALCRVPSDEVLPEYLACALLTPLGRDQLLASRYGQGKPGLNLRSLLDLRIPTPEVHRQRDVVRTLTRQRQRDQKLKLLREETGVEVEALVNSTLSATFG